MDAGFRTGHDGFTLRDLVSYNDKHNDANGEEGKDGSDDNQSWNCGAEGDSEDPRILALRARQQRNLLTTLLLSQGVLVIAHGDELGRTQRGNNNVYCQDSELSWVDWDLDETGRTFSPSPASWCTCAATTRCRAAAASSAATPRTAAWETWPGSCPFNGHHEPVEFRLPGTAFGDKWHVTVDTFPERGNRARTGRRLLRAP